MSFDFDAAVVAPFRMQPGLRRLKPGSAQLTPSASPTSPVEAAPDSRSTRHLREKLAVLAAFPQQALLSRPGFDAAPALAALAAQASLEHPSCWSCSDGQWSARRLGHGVDADGHVIEQRSPWPEVGAVLKQLPSCWRRAALLSLAFEEDFAIIDARDGTIPWLAVTMPSAWAPEDKVGRHFADVHAHVADNRLIVQASDHLVRLVTGQERWERFVWTLTPHPRLHAHPDRLDPARWPSTGSLDELVALTWWRTERQTFIPVPHVQQAVFTIQIDTQPLSSAINSPSRAARVHAALGSMSQAVLQYRGLTSVHGRLLNWLASRTGHAGPDPA